MILRRNGGVCSPRVPLLSALAIAMAALLACSRPYPGVAPSITSANTAICTEGVAGYFPVKASGTPIPTITESGALPDGITFTDSILGGTPSQIGTYQITFTAQNGISPNAVQNFTLTVNPP
jgi:hypothetical protein